MFQHRIMSLVGLACLGSASPALSSELLVNGNFETGNLSGWTVINQAGGSGDWFAHANGANTPLSGQSSPSLGVGGLFIAVTDQTGPGSHQLTQSFNAIAGGTYILSFDAYASDLSGVAPIGSGLDYNTPMNQHLEINLSGAANGQIFTGTYAPAWGSYSYDISSFITASGLYTLSFGEVDNQLFYNFGLDNVSLRSAGAVPEPATWAMMLLGFGAIGYSLRSRKVGYSALPTV